MNMMRSLAAVFLASLLASCELPPRPGGQQASGAAGASGAATSTGATGASGASGPSGAPPAPPTPPPAAAWRPLFDGKTLEGWKKTEFGGEAEPRVEDGRLILPAGEPMTGVTWTRDFPKVDYEIELEAMKVDGNDFFCGLTFPVKEGSASLILGGWGGNVCGISCIDGHDASENETTFPREFEDRRWYRVRVRVTKAALEAWLGEEKIVDVETEGKRIQVRGDIAASKPLGLATYRTTAALRDVKWRPAGP
jgi:3-keto-disaccharide hydrolase